MVFSQFSRYDARPLNNLALAVSGIKQPKNFENDDFCWPCPEMTSYSTINGGGMIGSFRVEKVPQCSL